MKGAEGQGNIVWHHQAIAWFDPTTPLQNFETKRRVRLLERGKAMGLKIHKYPDLSGPLYHYNNSVTLRFSKKHWLYLMEGENGLLTPIGGITNTLKIVDKSQALIGWATRLFMEKTLALIQANRRDEFVEVEYDDLVAILSAAKNEHRNVLEAAGETGHDAHAFVESLVKATIADDENRRLEVLAKFPEDQRASNAAVAAVCFFADHNVRYIAAEQRLMSKRLLVAGTMDGDILMDSCHDPDCPCQQFAPFTNKRMVLDLKTSNQVVETYAAQTAIYAEMKREEFGTVFDGRVILRLGKDDASEFEPWFYFGQELQDKHLQFFERALALKQSVEETAGDMKAVKDARREKIKAAKEAAARIRCPKADGYKGTRKSKCFEDGTQCEACTKIWVDKQAK